MSDGLDLAAVEARWLHLCGSCDAALPMSCTCPAEDPRAAIGRLVDRVRELEAAQAKVREAAVSYIDRQGAARDGVALTVHVICEAILAALDSAAVTG